jgi:hypothetical protein
MKKNSGDDDSLTNPWRTKYEQPRSKTMEAAPQACTSYHDCPGWDYGDHVPCVRNACCEHPCISGGGTACPGNAPCLIDNWSPGVLPQYKTGCCCREPSSDANKVSKLPPKTGRVRPALNSHNNGMNFFLKELTGKSVIVDRQPSDCTLAAPEDRPNFCALPSSY